MASKRYNIWLDLILIDRIKVAATKMGVKISTYVRMAVLEKLGEGCMSAPKKPRKSPWTKEQTKQYQHEYYLKNKAKYAARTKAFYEANRQFLNDWRKQYYLDNREQELAQTRAYKDEKLKTDIAFKLECRIRNRLGTVLRRLGVTKSKRTIELVGCTYIELKTYLEGLFYDGMTWDRFGVGPGTFQIDHIVPVALFDLTDPEQQHKCFHYTNLQPLWDQDHKAKTREDMKIIRANKA